jgi:hypothetical protein
MWGGFVSATLLHLSFERGICWLVYLRVMVQFSLAGRLRRQEICLWLVFEVVTSRILNVSAMYSMAEVDGQDYHVEC